MKILLLHPKDELPRLANPKSWDLVVDLAQAPSLTYEYWSRLAGCEVTSIYRYAREIEDLYRLRELLQTGRGHLVDRSGMNWWDVLSPEIVSGLLQSLLLHRLSRKLHTACKLICSRPDPQANVLANLLGVRLTAVQTRFQAFSQRAQRYSKALSQLDPAQLVQVLEDKFDSKHAIRRRFSHVRHSSSEPLILLPSAYVNVTRTALAYAELLPDHRFLLVATRSSGSPKSLPPNVTCTSQSPYFCATDKTEIQSLQDAWRALREKLLRSAPEFQIADELGVLQRIPDLIPWAIALRDAWKNVFDLHNVVGCLCADDSNPPSSIPLLLARQRGIAAIACHHGALDCREALKPLHADFYLAKSAMEQDYLQRICRRDQDKIVVGPLSLTTPVRPPARSHAPWIAFFTEPYSNSGWRSEDVYRDLSPRLWSLAQRCGLKLVFKLHPFDNISSHRRLLRRHLGKYAREIALISGPPTSQLWENIRFAITVQSSTALECVERSIPVFLCGWLRDPFSGYVQQFERFDVGRVLESAEQIAQIPCLLELKNETFSPRRRLQRTMTPEQLASLFSGAHTLAAASNG